MYVPTLTGTGLEEILIHSNPSLEAGTETQCTYEQTYLKTSQLLMTQKAAHINKPFPICQLTYCKHLVVRSHR